MMKFVNDKTANEQINRIHSLVNNGFSDTEIARTLTENNVTNLKSGNHIWEPEDIKNIRESFKLDTKDVKAINDPPYEFTGKTMSLKKCKDCGNSVSSSAKACPHCGAPMQGRGIISSLVRFFVIVFVIIPIGIAIFRFVYQSETSTRFDSSGTTSREPDPKKVAISNIELKNLAWQKAGFDNIMEVSVTLANKGARGVKDIELQCEHFSNSGTRIDSNKQVIYEIVSAGKSKSIKNFNMGFIHSQAVKTSCFVSDLVLM